MNRRRTIRLAWTAVVALVGLTLAGCTGSDDEPRRLVDDASATQTPAPAQPTDDTATGTVSGDSTLAAALTVVPAAAEVMSFTDLAAAKSRLGYGDLTGESPTRDRFEFWETARADSSLFTGTRLYDESSELSIDYGWTAEDINWEVDFSAPEDGCKRSMICERSSGYVVALRRDIAWRTILTSLQENGFTPTGEGNIWQPPTDSQEPFDLVVLIPELNAIGSGNPLGVKRMADVTQGAPNALDGLTPVVAGLGTVESAYLDTGGCVTLEQALGPDATEDDVTAYFKKNDPSELAVAQQYGVGLINTSSALSIADLGHLTTDSQESARRQAVLTGWPGLQAGKPFAEVADSTVTVNPGATGSQVERTVLNVHDLATFRSMVFTDDAPWALCPTAVPR